MTHQRNRRAADACAAVLAVLVGSLAGCATDPPQVPSEFPAPDFRLVVEALREDGVVHRRFEAGADGVCVYGEAPDALSDPETDAPLLPVFGTLCAYRLLRDNTRQLNRMLHKGGVRDLKQGEPSKTKGPSVRVYYRAFHEERNVVASGTIYGAMVRVLRVVNSYLPRGVEFKWSGMRGDPEPSTLRGVPQPKNDVKGALRCFQDLLVGRPNDDEMLVHAFALACRAGDHAAAMALLERWTAATGGSPAPAPFADPPRLAPELLMQLVPP